MKLNEAKQILKNNGYLLEDTETHDDEEFPLTLRKKEILKKADKENRRINDEEWKEIDKLDRQIDKIPDTNRSLWSKKNQIGVWAIKVVVSSDAYDEEKDEYVDDYTLGYLRLDGTIARKFGDDCLLNYEQCWDLLETHAKYNDGPAKPKFEKAWKQQFKITDKHADIYLSAGTIKKGKFHYKNLEYTEPEDI